MAKALARTSAIFMALYSPDLCLRSKVKTPSGSVGRSSTSGTLQGLRVPALVGPLDDDRVAVLLSQDRSADADAVLGRLSERLHAVSERRSEARLVIGAGSTVPGIERAQDTLREAMQVAETAMGLPPQRAYFRSPDLRLRGL